MTTVRLRFRLNGAPVDLHLVEGRSALQVLRDDLGLTSMKIGCTQGVCGCCTVIVDGKARITCTFAARMLEGRSVTTLEGIPETDRTIYTRAFQQEGGHQCGFCTPGIVMRVHALLCLDPDPSEAAIRKALGAHVCRCTGWHGILRSVRLAAGLVTEKASLLPAGAPFGSCDSGVPPTPGGAVHPRLRVAYGGPSRQAIHLGESRSQSCADETSTSLPRYLGEAAILGRRPFIQDISRPGMLHGALVWTPAPRCRVLRIDTSGALALPGVHHVATAADFSGKRHVGQILSDWPAMVAEGEETRCMADVLAAVAADTRDIARRAAALVKVDVEILPPVTDLEQAALDPKNLLSLSTVKRGDVDAAFQRCAAFVAETFHTQRNDQAFLEPEASLAWMREDGVLHVLSSGQGVFDDRRQLAALFGLPLEQVVVELVAPGGAFGGREDLSVQHHAALLARITGRPLHLRLEMTESLRFHAKRHPMILRYEVGADAHGRLLGLRVRVLGDTGGYASVGMKVLERLAGHAAGPYAVDDVDVEARAILTNNPLAGAFRGFGVPQAAFALEGCLDRLADRLGIDRLEIRFRNALRPGDLMHTGQRVGPEVAILQTLEAIRPHYERLVAEGRKVGIACGMKSVGLGNGFPEHGKGALEVRADDVLIHAAFTEMGQGHDTVLIQYASEVTGLPPHLFQVRCDTVLDLDVGMTTASRGTFLGGWGILEAARAMRAALDGVGGDLAALRGRVYMGDWPAPPTQKMTHVDPYVHYSFGYATHVAVLDAEGQVEEIIAAHDVGRIVNPLLCRGQVEGGVVMGLGFALTEEIRVEGGVPDTRYHHLGVPRVGIIPKITTILVEHPDPLGPLGAKGIGEIVLVPTAAAIAGALREHDGRWRSRLPLTVKMSTP